MFKSIYQFIDSFFPYKVTGDNNKIFIITKGKKKELKRKIKGLKLNISGSNNYLEFYLPINFKNTDITIEGENASFIMMSTITLVNGASIYIGSYGECFIDEDVRLNRPNFSVVINNNENNKPHKLIIGKSVQIGKNISIRTSDGHAIFNKNEAMPYNEPEDVIIGNNVWLGERVMILKGSNIPSNSIVGACSLVSGDFIEENCIIAGNPAKIIKREIRWARESYGYFKNNKHTDKHINDSIKKIIIKKIKRNINKILFKYSC